MMLTNRNLIGEQPQLLFISIASDKEDVAL